MDQRAGDLEGERAQQPEDDEDDGDDVIWLVGGEDEDVDVFLDAIEITPE